MSVKDQFHRKYRMLLVSYAKKLGLKKGEYTVRSNPAGFGILGEVVLHANHLYVSVGGSLPPDRMPDASTGILYRHCENQKDYTGGRNQYMTFGMLLDRPAEALERFQETMDTDDGVNYKAR